MWTVFFFLGHGKIHFEYFKPEKYYGNSWVAQEDARFLRVSNAVLYVYNAQFSNKCL